MTDKLRTRHPPPNIREELERASRPEKGSRSDKKNYAQRLSDLLAVRFANELRGIFPGIRPNEDGRGRESQALGIAGSKKLDVNYSTPTLGLGVGISIKTLNFPDIESKRFTKNYTRIDNELRAEAHDYHRRQPFAVLVGLVFLPIGCCDDGNPARPRQSRSSFGQAIRVFRRRAGRTSPTADADRFERVFVALYEPEGPNFGGLVFFDVMNAPPQFGRPPTTAVIDIGKLQDEITSEFLRRNKTDFEWANQPPREHP